MEFRNQARQANKMDGDSDTRTLSKHSQERLKTNKKKSKTILMKQKSFLSIQQSLHLKKCKYTNSNDIQNKVENVNGKRHG